MIVPGLVDLTVIIVAFPQVQFLQLFNTVSPLPVLPHLLRLLYTLAP
jgi:hypothetical protein